MKRLTATLAILLYLATPSVFADAPQDVEKERQPVQTEAVDDADRRNASDEDAEGDGAAIGDRPRRDAVSNGDAATRRKSTSGKSAARPAKASDAPEGQPASSESSADELIGEMLKPPPPTAGKPLPTPDEPPATDRTSGPGAVRPKAPPVTVMREGTFLVDRIGRLTRSADGSQAEFAFESDGQALQDPPVVIVPNLKLMAMEDAAQAANRDLRFRITGVVTEYRGRNYVLLEKVVVVPDVTQQYRRTQQP